MKFLLVLSFIILFCYLGFSQETGFAIAESKEITGVRHSQNMAINSTVYTFPDKLNYFYLDTIAEVLTATCYDKPSILKDFFQKNNRTIFSFDLKGQKVKWTKRFSGQRDWLTCYPNFVILSKVNGSYALNGETGQEKWEIPMTISMVDVENRVALGYNNTDPMGIGINRLMGIDINSGIVLWQRKLVRTRGWGKVRYIDKNTALIVADGVHAVNVKDGTGWSFKTLTRNRFGWNFSNVLTDSTNCYFVSDESLTCLEKSSGKLKWTHFFMDNLIGRAAIYFKDSAIVVINESEPNDKCTAIINGIAFIAAYHIKTGKEIYYQMISNRIPISDYQAIRDTLWCLSVDRISKYSLRDGKLVSEKPLRIENANQLYFADRHLFIKDTDSTYKQLVACDSTQIFIGTDEKSVTALNSKLEKVKQYNIADLYVPYWAPEGCLFLKNDEKTIVIDKNLKEVATLNLKGRIKLIGNKLYKIVDNKLIITDMKDVVDPCISYRLQN